MQDPASKRVRCKKWSRKIHDIDLGTLHAHEDMIESIYSHTCTHTGHTHTCPPPSRMHMKRRKRKWICKLISIKMRPNPNSIHTYSCILGSPIGGTVWEGLDCVALLEMVWHWGWALKFQKSTTFMVSPLWLMVGLKMWAISWTSNLCQKLVALFPTMIIVSKSLKL